MDSKWHITTCPRFRVTFGLMKFAEIDLPEAIKFKSDASTNSRLRPGSLCPWPRALGPWPRARGVVLVLPLKLIVSGRSIAKCINSHGRPK